MPLYSPSYIKDVNIAYGVNNINGKTFFEATLQIHTATGKYKEVTVSCEEPIESWKDLNQELKKHVVDKFSNELPVNTPIDK